MSAIAHEVWSRLQADSPSGDALVARLAAPEKTSRLQAALDQNGARHFLIRLTPNEDDFRDAESRGIVVATRELRLAGEEPDRFLDVMCLDGAGHAVFDLIGFELADALSAGGQSPSGIVARVLGRWRRFWGQLPRQILSQEEQLGLFAELWFLSIWLFPRCGTAEAIHRWRGPYGARHDFEWQGKSVEVKATLRNQGRIHRINGIDQLALPEQGELFLFSLRVREEAGATNTLPSVVRHCRSLLASEPELLNRWEAALAAAGYSLIHEEEYEKIHLRIVDEFLYRVDGDFPRLTEAQIPNGLSPGVDAVTYEINLNGFSHLVVSGDELVRPALN